MKLLSLFAVGTMLLAGVLLFRAGAPVRGAIQFVGGGRTDRDIKASGRWRKVQRYVGFTLLVLGAVAQAVVIYRTP